MAEPYLICPKSWRRSTLEPDGDLITRVDSGGTPSTSVDAYWDGDLPWLTPKEITSLQDGLFVSRTERSITQLGLEHSSAKLLPPGTVMLSKRAPVGAVAVNAVPMATNQGFLNFRCGPALRPLYLAYWLRANRPYLDKVANGSTYPELYQSDLFEFELAVPPLDVQDRIIEVLSALQFAALLGLPLEQSVTRPEAMVALQAQNRRLSSIRDALLPQLLSGALDVSKKP
ncbi:restriction endonuclease subunit S [Polyangium sorediatum]|uniref:Restriction endonuclease subunit S n=1 Tax=Polyangium sorediatum TaxID=889274 RepID=A0ABT6P033_9BACT|nr:restriction endonuclease subunit S [Polyangium sorediatum]MDI1433876.1 restriction endonuclease subunit S [Polyangium sorediatum]